jgi:hypothetical protein
VQRTQLCSPCPLFLFLLRSSIPVSARVHRRGRSRQLQSHGGGSVLRACARAPQDIASSAAVDRPRAPSPFDRRARVDRRGQPAGDVARVLLPDIGCVCFRLCNMFKPKTQNTLAKRPAFNARSRTTHRRISRSFYVRPYNHEKRVSSRVLLIRSALTPATVPNKIIRQHHVRPSPKFRSARNC